MGRNKKYIQNYGGEIPQKRPFGNFRRRITISYILRTWVVRGGKWMKLDVIVSNAG
jgi:hypothetical protein